MAGVLDQRTTIAFETERSRHSQGLPYAAAWALHYSVHDRDR